MSGVFPRNVHDVLQPMSKKGGIDGRVAKMGVNLHPDRGSHESDVQIDPSSQTIGV